MPGEKAGAAILFAAIGAVRGKFPFPVGYRACGIRPIWKRDRAARHVEECGLDAKQRCDVDCLCNGREISSMVDIKRIEAVLGEPDILQLHDRPLCEEAEVLTDKTSKTGQVFDIVSEQYGAQFDPHPAGQAVREGFHQAIISAFFRHNGIVRRPPVAVQRNAPETIAV